MSTILIAGAGQLGSRYLQGLSKTVSCHTIIVYDVSQDSLLLAEKRYAEVEFEGRAHQVSYITDLLSIPRHIDVAIISLSSFPRAEFVEKLSDRCKVEYWILEKVLAPSLAELDRLGAITDQCTNGWVNHWLRLPLWSSRLKASLLTAEKASITMDVTGSNWGLACNASHYLDLFGWLTDQTLVSMVTERLESHWEESKRDGYYDVYGELKAHYSDSSLLRICCDRGNEPLSIRVKWCHGDFLLVFSLSGEAQVSQTGFEDKLYPPMLQSKMTAVIVDQILEAGDCGLASCKEALATHRCMISSLVAHWNQVNVIKTDRIPIT
jgi:predicted dehydrogenase